MGGSMFRGFKLRRSFVFYYFIVERLSWLNISTENLRRQCTILIFKRNFRIIEALNDWLFVIFSCYGRYILKSKLFFILIRYILIICLEFIVGSVYDRYLMTHIGIIFWIIRYRAYWIFNVRLCKILGLNELKTFIWRRGLIRFNWYILIL
jgi:hypothetical protein